MVLFLMTDENVSVVGKALTYLVQYVFGFPLVLLNSDYPFFLNSNTPPRLFLLLIATNLIIQTFLVLGIKRLKRKT